MGVVTGSIAVLTDALKMASDSLKTAVTVGANVGKASLNTTNLLVKATTSLDVTFSNVTKEFTNGIKDFNKIQIQSAAINREANQLLGSMGDDFKNLPGDMLSNLQAPLDLFALNVRSIGPAFLRLHNRLRLTGANTAQNTESLVRLNMLTGRGQDSMEFLAQNISTLSNKSGILAERLLKHSETFVDSTQKLRLQIGEEAFRSLTHGVRLVTSQMPAAGKEITALFTALQDEKKRMMIGGALGLEKEIKELFSGTLDQEGSSELFKEIVLKISDRMDDILPKADGSFGTAAVRSRMDDTLIAGVGTITKTIAKAIGDINTNEIPATFNQRIRTAKNVIDQQIFEPIRLLAATYMGMIETNAEDIQKLVSSNIIPIFQDLFSSFVRVWNNTDMEGLFVQIGTIFQSLVTTSSEMINIFTKLVGGEGEGLNKFADVLQKVIGHLMGFAGSMVEIIPTLIRGLVFLTNVITETIDTLVDILQVVSLGTANFFGAGKVEAMDEAVDAMSEKALAFADSVEEGTTAFGSALRMQGESLIAGEAGGFAGPVPTATELTSFVDKIKADDSVNRGEVLRTRLLLEEMTTLASTGNADAAARQVTLETIVEELEGLREAEESYRGKVDTLDITGFFRKALVDAMGY